MKMKQMEKQRALVPVLQENKHLTDLISKVKEEKAEKEKKMKYCTLKKVIL